MTKIQKPMASEYTNLKSYIADMQTYYKQMGKNHYKVAPHVYKEMGIYSIQDLLEHREANPWSRVDL
jgi:predicted transcriptional regulator